MAVDRSPHGDSPLWTADMIRVGDPYELSGGQRIGRLPAVGTWAAQVGA